MPHISSPAPPAAEPSLQPLEGWHCAHFYYAFDRGVLAGMRVSDIAAGRLQMREILDPHSQYATTRMQTTIVSGHRADFGLLLMDPNPLKIDAIHQRLLGTGLGPALRPVDSFISLTEVSEYVPTVEQYAARLLQEGEREDSPTYWVKVKSYESRLPVMRAQRLTPELPSWPATCFYPMNKKRHVGENWYTLPFSVRSRLMAEHARSGMEFAGRVSQLITVGIGLDDWEWGVTLWARNPQYLREIVYRMRFDEASARYAEFGHFYVGYVKTPTEVLDHCGVGVSGASVAC